MSVGVGPHNYSIDYPKVTIYQLLKRRVNLTILLADKQSESYEWVYYEGNFKLDFEILKVLHKKEIFQTTEWTPSVLPQNSSYNGIQIVRIQVVNDKIRRRGKRVTINTGGKHYCTNLHFRSEYLQYVHI